MIVGSTILKLGGGSYYTPSFPRGGLAATFSIDVTHIAGSPTVSVVVEHKNSDETSWSSVGSSQSVTGTGVTMWNVEDIKEEARVAFGFDAGDDDTDGIHFVLMAPAWRQYP